MNDILIGAIAAIGGTIIGAGITIIQLTLNHKREQHKNDNSLLVSALTFLSGNDNQRSCGISIIEGIFINKKDYFETLVPALTNQATYLLLHAKASGSRTEIHNWLRIMELLVKIISKYEINSDLYGEIGNSFLIKMESNHVGGIDISEPTLNAWSKKISSIKKN